MYHSTGSYSCVIVLIYLSTDGGSVLVVISRWRKCILCSYYVVLYGSKVRVVIHHSIGGSSAVYSLLFIIPQMATVYSLFFIIPQMTAVYSLLFIIPQMAAVYSLLFIIPQMAAVHSSLFPRWLQCTRCYSSFHRWHVFVDRCICSSSTQRTVAGQAVSTPKMASCSSTGRPSRSSWSERLFIVHACDSLN